MFAYKLFDEKDDKIIKTAFNCDFADERKNMIRNFDGQYLDYENAKTVSCENYVNQELLHFWMEDNTRSIPYLYDGLKDS
jgi:hypothetical protein